MYTTLPGQAKITPALHLQVIHDEVEKLNDFLSERIAGQDAAIKKICDELFVTLLLAGSQENNGRNGPETILTFMGPPGVGKTHAANLVAQYLQECRNGSAAQEYQYSDGLDDFLRLDMSGYSGHQAHEGLIGSDAVYKESAKGFLSGFVADRPRAVILVDEVEKAHPHVLNLFLQIVERGQLLDLHTRAWVDFSKTSLLFTTNLGQELCDIQHGSNSTLAHSMNQENALVDALCGSPDDVDEGLSPELASRLAKGSVAMFSRLNGAALIKLAEMTFTDAAKEIRSTSGLRIDVDAKQARLLYTLFALRFAANGDGRRLRSGVRSMVIDAVRKLAAQCITASTTDRWQFVLPASEVLLPLGIPKADGCYLVFFDSGGETCWPADLGPDFVTERCSNHTALQCALSSGNKVDFLIVNVNVSTTAFDESVEVAVRVLDQIRQPPKVVLLSDSPGHRGPAADRLQSEYGAIEIFKGVSLGLTQGAKIKALRGRLTAQLEVLRMNELVDAWRRGFKALDFTLTPEIAATGGNGEIRLTQLRSVTSVRLQDSKLNGWVDVPDVRFDDVAGAVVAKTRLREVASWLSGSPCPPALQSAFPRGILLDGPPGNGKTMLARALAGEVNAVFLSTSGSQLRSSYHGESESNLRRVFSVARRYAPAIIFLDELDSIGLARHRPDDNGSSHALLHELLIQLDGFESADSPPVLFLAACNHADRLDPALLRPGRLDLIIHIPYPDAAARAELFEQYCARYHTETKLLDIEVLSNQTAGFSGADIAQICKDAALLAMRAGRNAPSADDVQHATDNSRKRPC